MIAQISSNKLWVSLGAEEQCPLRASGAGVTRQCQPLSTAALLSPARAGPSTLSGFYKEQRGEKSRMKSGWGLVLLGRLKRSAPVHRRWRAGEKGLQPAAGHFFVCTSLIPWDGLRCRPCCRVFQAGGRGAGRAGLCPPSLRAMPGALGGCEDGRGRGEGDAAGAGSQGRLCLPGVRRRQGSQRCAWLRRAAKCVRLPRLRERLGAGTR